MPLLLRLAVAAALMEACATASHNTCEHVPKNSIKKAQAAGDTLYLVVENQHGRRAIVAAHAQRTEMILDGVDFAHFNDDWLILRQTGRDISVVAAANKDHPILRTSVGADETAIGVTTFDTAVCVVTSSRVLCTGAPAVRMSQALYVRGQSRVVATETAVYVAVKSGLWRVDRTSGQSDRIDPGTGEVRMLQARKDKRDCVIAAWTHVGPEAVLYEVCNRQAPRKLHPDTEVAATFSADDRRALRTTEVLGTLQLHEDLRLQALPFEACGSLWLIHDVPLMIEAFVRGG